MKDWKNWKTGAKIGLLYGIICVIYTLPVLIAQYSPNPDFPIRQCDDTCVSWYKFAGTVIFFPLVIGGALIVSPFYLDIPVNSLILIYSVTMILLGTVLGAAAGHLSGSFGGSQEK